MKKIEKRALMCRLLALFLAAGMVLFLLRWCASGSRWASAAFNRHLYNNAGYLSVGTVLDRDGDVLTAVSESGARTYYDNETVRKATLHAVGDLQGAIGTGALTAFADRLTGFDLINGAYGADRGRELYLTIDARYNYEAYQALNGRRGTVAVYNYKTGEVLCMVSAPSYDPLAVPEDIESNERYKGAYLNRFLSSTFTPGSVYKTVTLAAAIGQIPDLNSRTWECGGSIAIGGETITCSGVHGVQDVEAALANSCNVAFAQLALEVGEDALRRQTEQAGLTGRYDLDGISTAAGSFALTDLTEAQLAWAGVGQHRDLVNPCGLMVYMGAIAGGGKAAEPYLVEKTVSSLGLYNPIRLPDKTDRLLSADTAEQLRELMAAAAETAYGTARFPNMTLCAKSGTAEVGEGQPPHAWFAGFLADPETPYAFVVLVENGGGGNTVAGTIAGRVLNVIVNGY